MKFNNLMKTLVERCFSSFKLFKPKLPSRSQNEILRPLSNLRNYAMDPKKIMLRSQIYTKCEFDESKDNTISTTSVRFTASRHEPIFNKTKVVEAIETLEYDFPSYPEVQKKLEEVAKDTLANLGKL